MLGSKWNFVVNGSGNYSHGHIAKLERREIAEALKGNYRERPA